MGRPRKKKLPAGVYQRGRVYWIAYQVGPKRRVREHGGTTIEAAERKLRQRKDAVARGTWGVEAASADTTLSDFAEAFFRNRESRSRAREEQLFRDYVAPTFGDVAIADIRPMDVADWVARLKKKMAARSVRNAHGVLSVVLADARFRQHIPNNPAKDLPNKTLPALPVRTKGSWTRAEVELFATHPAIPEDRRVVYAIAACTGARLGEIAGMRRSDLRRDATPLWMWDLRTQYDGKPLKTDAPRKVPIHPELQAVLERWEAEGWERYAARPPAPSSFVVPREDSTVHSDNSMGAKAVSRHAKAAGIVEGDRDFHSFRRFFITHTREAGASSDVVERITHNAKGAVIDAYTFFGWETLCAAVMRLDLNLSARHTTQHTEG